MNTVDCLYTEIELNPTAYYLLGVLADVLDETENPELIKLAYGYRRMMELSKTTYKTNPVKLYGYGWSCEDNDLKLRDGTSSYDYSCKLPPVVFCNMVPPLNTVKNHGWWKVGYNTFREAEDAAALSFYITEVINVNTVLTSRA